MAVKGLSTKEVEKLTNEKKTNKVKNKSSKSIPMIIASNLFTYFNAIFLGLALLLIYAGAYKNLLILVVVVINVLIGIFQQIKSKIILDKLALLDVTEYIVIRDGKEEKIGSDKLVLGDYVKLESGQQIPADAVVVEGEASVNESLLTGEADEIEKKEKSELKSGSFLVSGKVIAKLTHVGEDSYAAKLSAKAKEVKEKKSEMIHDIETIVKVAGIIIIPVGILLVYQSVYVNGVPFKESIVPMIAAVTGMIPEGLYLLVTIALSLGAARLAKKQVLLHDMKSIEGLARVDVFCADKTGTLTKDVMDVTDMVGRVKETSKEIEEAKDILARYIQTVPDNNTTMRALREKLDYKEPLESTEVNPFSSKTKYSEVKTKKNTYRLGAPEYLLDKKDLEENKKIIESFANDGKRVLAFTEDKTPILFVALENELRDNVVEIFELLQKREVEVKVISGDNPLTVSKVAEKAGIINANKYVDATTLDDYTKIQDAVKRYTIFGRVKPEQKKMIVQALKENKLRVAMTGDGVNDILAMKEADCSIAMGEGSDAARGAAQIVLLNNDFSLMNNIIGEGRQIINNITRSASLFLYKNIFSLLLSVFSIIAVFEYPLKPTQVSLISLFNIGIPAFLLALEPNKQKQEGRFIQRVLVNAIPAALTSFIGIIAMIYFAKLFEIPQIDVATASIYLVSGVGFNILWYITKPFRKYNLFVFFVCFLGILVSANFFTFYFDIHGISIKATALCIVFGIAELTIMKDITFALDKVRQIKTRERLQQIKDNYKLLRSFVL